MTEKRIADTRSYEIVVKGQISGKRLRVFDGLESRYTDEGNTILTGPALDQAALFGLLIRIRDSGLTLIAVLPDSMEAG